MPSIALRNSWSMQTRNAARVLPDPVGAEISVGWPAWICGQPSICGSVGVPNRPTNHSCVMGCAQSRLAGMESSAPMCGVGGMLRIVPDRFVFYSPQLPVRILECNRGSHISTRPSGVGARAKTQVDALMVRAHLNQGCLQPLENSFLRSPLSLIAIAWQRCERLLRIAKVAHYSSGRRKLFSAKALFTRQYCSWGSSRATRRILPASPLSALRENY